MGRITRIVSYALASAQIDTASIVGTIKDPLLGGGGQKSP